MTGLPPVLMPCPRACLGIREYIPAMEGLDRSGTNSISSAGQVMPLGYIPGRRVRFVDVDDPERGGSLLQLASFTEGNILGRSIDWLPRNEEALPSISFERSSFSRPRNIPFHWVFAELGWTVRQWIRPMESCRGISTESVLSVTESRFSSGTVVVRGATVQLTSVSAHKLEEFPAVLSSIACSLFSRNVVSRVAMMDIGFFIEDIVIDEKRQMHSNENVCLRRFFGVKFPNAEELEASLAKSSIKEIVYGTLSTAIDNNLLHAVDENYSKSVLHSLMAALHDIESCLACFYIGLGNDILFQIFLYCLYVRPNITIQNYTEILDEAGQRKFSSFCTTQSPMAQKKGLGYFVAMFKFDATQCLLLYMDQCFINCVIERKLHKAMLNEAEARRMHYATKMFHHCLNVCLPLNMSVWQ